jgi:hypothetical protein
MREFLNVVNPGPQQVSTRANDRTFQAQGTSMEVNKQIIAKLQTQEGSK